ncbi:alpha/beta fold hydrolase [Oleiagrimonas sp. C23AA]|uniref:alpha/beta fold hydrolase n=1 Tax=Oleiagrimonas sp. C23AA TaxID=2719047 RepID=UPI0014208C08|nr:alpha/beta hydrolase [Oleiagrimonas sp. C23AA]
MKRTKLTIRIVVVLVAVAVYVAINHYKAHRQPSPKSSSPPTVADAKPVKPVPPRTWKLGKLTLTACDLGTPDSGQSTAAWCDDFEVPEDRTTPNGRHIKLRLAVVRSDAPDADMVVMLAGGPGQAATESYIGVKPAMEPLLKHHNILLLDQRGTGGSNPLTCPKSAKDTGTVKNVPTADIDKLKAQVAACRDALKSKADPRFYTTTDAVADLEAVRQALGSPRFDLVGVSYGTRMAQQYAMRHPDGVRAIVLDGVVPNRLILGEDFARNLDDALKKDFDACTATPACKKRFGNPYQTLYQLRDALRANPHEVTYRDPSTYHSTTTKLDGDTLATVVRLFAYTPETAALLPLSIDEAAHGDVGPLLGQAKLITGDLDASMNNGMQMSVVCAEDADQLKPRPQDADTLLGNTLINIIKAECSVWPHGAMPADFHQPLTGAIPTLLLSGERDPVTPPRYAKEVASHLSDARSLVLNGQGHNVIARGCTPELVKTFIDKLDPKKLDASCLDRMAAPPAFINFNGATP